MRVNRNRDSFVHGSQQRFLNADKKEADVSKTVNASSNSATTKDTSIKNRNIQPTKATKFSETSSSDSDLSSIKVLLTAETISTNQLYIPISFIIESKNQQKCKIVLQMLIEKVKQNQQNVDVLNSLFSLYHQFTKMIDKYDFQYTDMVFEFLAAFNHLHHDKMIDVLKSLAVVSGPGIKHGFFIPCTTTPGNKYFSTLIDIANNDINNNYKIGKLLVSIRKNIRNTVLKRYNAIISDNYNCFLALNLVNVISILKNSKHQEKLIKAFLLDTNINNEFRACFYLFLEDTKDDISSYFSCINIIKKIPAIDIIKAQKYINSLPEDL